METIKVHDKTFRPFIRHNDLMAAIDQVAKKIRRDYAGCTEPPVLLCTLHGAIPFTTELMMRIDFDVELAGMQISSYEGTQSTGSINSVLGPTIPLKGKKVIIVEDIVDTGLTIVEMRKIVKDNGAAEVKVCSLLYKSEKFCRQMEEQGLDPTENEPEYYGIDIPDSFVVGFGLDYDKLGRNYKDIYILEP